MDLILARRIDRWIGPPLTRALRGMARLRGERLPPAGARTPAAALLAAPRRVLAMKFYGLGNVALILPVLQALHRTHPGVEIDFLTLPGANATLLQQSGLVRRVLVIDVGTVGRFVRGALALPARLAHGGYDTVIDFEQFLKISTIFAFLSGARRRIAFDTEGQHRTALATTRIAYTDTDHAAELFARLVAPLGVPAPAPGDWRLPVPEPLRTAARALLVEAGAGPAARIAAIHVGTGPNTLKRWDVDRFAALGDALCARHGLTVVFTGVGADERALIRGAIAHMRQPAVDLADRLDAGTLSGLLAEATLLVSTDTGIMHLAGLVDTPVVALFGPTSPRSYGPRQPGALVFYERLYCSPCITNYNMKLSRCTDPVCMRSITVDAVLARIERECLGRDGRPVIAQAR